MKELKGTINFDSKDLIYNVHFPGNPVVPGSLILGTFVDILSSETGASGITVNNFNFSRFVNPGNYRYTITFSDNTATCRLFKNDEVLSRGKITYED